MSAQKLAIYHLAAIMLSSWSWPVSEAGYFCYESAWSVEFDFGRTLDYLPTYLNISPSSSHELWDQYGEISQLVYTPEISLSWNNPERPTSNSTPNLTTKTLYHLYSSAQHLAIYRFTCTTSSSTCKFYRSGCHSWPAPE